MKLKITQNSLEIVLCISIIIQTFPMKSLKMAVWHNFNENNRCCHTVSVIRQYTFAKSLLCLIFSFEILIIVRHSKDYFDVCFRLLTTYIDKAYVSLNGRQTALKANKIFAIKNNRLKFRTNSNRKSS